MKYTPGQLLRRHPGSSENVSELVIVISNHVDVWYLCTTGPCAGRLQIVCSQTANRFYEHLLHIDER